VNVKKLDKAILALADGLSFRDIEVKFHVDRLTLSHFLAAKAGKVKITVKFAVKVAEDVRKHKLSFASLCKKYGRRGVKALREYRTLKQHYDRQTKESEIISLKENNPTLSVHKVAEHFHISDTEAYYILQRHVKGSVTNVALLAAQKRKERVLALFHTGYSKQDIAVLEKCHEHTIRIILRDAGLSTSTRKVSVTDFPQIKRLQEAGMSFKEIAFIFNTTPANVRSIFSNYQFIKEADAHECKTK
jgi:hypothetical protein